MKVKGLVAGVDGVVFCNFVQGREVEGVGKEGNGPSMASLGFSCWWFSG